MFRIPTRLLDLFREIRSAHMFSILALFFICGSSQAIAQTIANQSPAPTAQVATPDNASAPDLEGQIDTEVAGESREGNASLTEVNKELSNPTG
jgi:hypothetical protein